MAQKGFLSLNVKSHQPLRPAPPPPVAVKPNLGSSSSRSSPMGQEHDSVKKKNAPPRPPPPKPSAQLKAVHNALVFTEMLQKQTHSSSSQMASTPSCGPPQDLLINWDAPSPSTSPTPGRYSSDGLSLRSFGSDSSGIMANGGSLSHANSRSESGFESEPDAWSENTASYAPPPVVAAAAESLKPFVMPTIIRPNRPTKPVTSNSSSTHLQALEKKINSNSNCELLSDLIDIKCPTIDNSPPEPTIPPPAPPTFYLDEPESSRDTVIDQRSQPCAEALFDYSSSHPGDLNFKEGDRILLESRVNDEWLRGSVGSKQGIFPVSFVHILVPLEEPEEVVVVEEEKPQVPAPTQAPSSQASSYRAVAIYPFEAETSQDLSLQEGDEVDVSESLGNGWLYGRECLSGRYGQFPEAFVRAV